MRIEFKVIVRITSKARIPSIKLELHVNSEGTSEAPTIWDADSRFSSEKSKNVDNYVALDHLSFLLDLINGVKNVINYM